MTALAGFEVGDVVLTLAWGQRPIPNGARVRATIIAHSGFGSGWVVMVGNDASGKFTRFEAEMEHVFE